MRIRSIDERCFVEIRSTSEGYGICEVEASIDLGHGVFTARNGSLALLELSEFIVQFEAFVLNREVEARLEGTYDTFLAFHSKGNAVFLDFSVGDGFCGYSSYAPFNLSGRFDIDSDHLLSLLSDFRELGETA